MPWFTLLFIADGHHNFTYDDGQDGSATYQNWWDSIRGQNGSLNAVRTDLTIPETYIYGTTYSNIVTQGDNGNGIEESPWNYVSKNGKVTRPAYGENFGKESKW